jgi:hypothetical protein
MCVHIFCEKCNFEILYQRPKRPKIRPIWSPCCSRPWTSFVWTFLRHLSPRCNTTTIRRSKHKSDKKQNFLTSVFWGANPLGWPDWANFRLLADCLLRAVAWKWQKKAKMLGNLFHGKSYVLMLTKNRLGYSLGDFFTNSSGHPGPLPLLGPFFLLLFCCPSPC